MKKLMTMLAFAGFVFLIGAVGAYDTSAATTAEMLGQCAVGGVMIAAGLLGIRAVDVFRRKQRLKERYRRIRTICEYEAECRQRMV